MADHTTELHHWATVTNPSDAETEMLKPHAEARAETQLCRELLRSIPNGSTVAPMEFKWSMDEKSPIFIPGKCYDVFEAIALAEREHALRVRAEEGLAWTERLASQRSQKISELTEQLKEARVNADLARQSSTPLRDRLAETAERCQRAEIGAAEWRELYTVERKQHLELKAELAHTRTCHV